MPLPINLVPDAVQTSADWRHIPWSWNRQLLPLANHASRTQVRPCLAGPAGLVQKMHSRRGNSV